MKPTYVSLIDDVVIDNYSGEEIPLYHLSLMTNNENIIKTYTSRSFNKLYKLGEKIAHDRGIDFINDAMELH